MVCRCVCCNYRFGYFLWSVVVSAGFTIGLSAFLLLEVAVSAWFMSGLASFYCLVLLVLPRLLFRNRIIFNAHMILTRIAYCWEIYFNNRIINLFTFYIWEEYSTFIIDRIFINGHHTLPFDLEIFPN